MDCDIERATEIDIPAILELMREFAEYEKLSACFEITETRLRDAMFGKNAFVEGLIARDGDGGAGYAIFYPNFSTFRGQKGFFLEDLYISAKHRGTGLGKLMLREIAVLARSRGFERMDFHVLDWNRSAIGFYERFGAVAGDDERYFKLTDEAFVRLAGDSTIRG